MKITIHQEKERRAISVLGSDWSGVELEQLLAEANRPDSDQSDFIFYDAPVLPASLATAFSRAVAQERTPKIRAFHSFLRYFLSRLDIPYRRVSRSQKPAASGPFKAIVLGGSADSLQKMMSVVADLPPAEASVFVVQHVGAGEVNLLDQLLQTCTDWQVHMVQHLEPIKPGVIYVAPPDAQMKISTGYIYLTRDAKVQYAKPSIEALFESAGREYKEQLIAVLFCGYGQDGVKTLAELKAGGSTIIIEDPVDCTAKALLEEAIKTGHADMILRIKSIGCYIASALSAAERTPSPQMVDLFLEALVETYGYDFRGYRPETTSRRFELLAQENGYQSFFQLQAEILKYPQLFENLFLEFSVKVTHFFRNPEQFQFIRTQLKDSLSSFPSIKVWSAGCASGEEAYSLAILLDQMGLLEKSQIYATDINPYLLEIARNGLYAKKELEDSVQRAAQSGISKNLLECFEPEHGLMKVKERYMDRVFFDRHSLAQDGVFNEFQLILCRNVFIYFSPELRHKAIHLFAASLHSDGFLMIGQEEGNLSEISETFFNRFDTQHRVYHLNEETTYSRMP